MISDHPDEFNLISYQPGQPVSVVLICRNKEDSLPHILASLAQNTYRPDCVVLSDDASTDNSQNVFFDLCIKHQLPSKIVSHDATGAQPAFRINTLRNDGVSACPDGLVIILDADLVPARAHLEAHIDLHLKNNHIPTISTGPRLEYAYSNCSGPINFMWGHEPVAMLQASLNEPVPSWAAIPGSLIGITKQAFKELGGFDPIYDGHYGFDDVDFMYRAQCRQFFFAASFDAYAIHIPHPPVFGERNGDVNREKFRQKYGFEFYQEMPAIYQALGRRSWSEYYQTILDQLKLTRQAKIPYAQMSELAVPMLDMNSIDGRFLLKIIFDKLIRKLILGFKIR